MPAIYEKFHPRNKPAIWYFIDDVHFGINPLNAEFDSLVQQT